VADRRLFWPAYSDEPPVSDPGVAADAGEARRTAAAESPPVSKSPVEHLLISIWLLVRAEVLQTNSARS
jgi:hypothetical protein